MRIWKLNIILVCVVLVSLVGAQVPTNMTISLDALGSCNSSTAFKVGDTCQFQLTIMVPGNTPTNMVIEIDSSDNSSNIVAQICRPTITWGSNYNITNAPYPQMVSSLGTSQFDTVTIDFGVIKNSASLSTAAANTITILFTAVIISNGQTNGQTMWITVSVDYYSDTEIWIGQGGLTFASDSPTQTASASFSSGTATGNVQVGSFNTFSATLQITGSRYHSLTLIANSSALSNNPITVCSVHVQSAGFCYTCLDSVKANVFSAFAKDSNTATLNLGYIPNIGFNAVNSTATNAYITVYVTYKASEAALVGTTGTTTQINLIATVGFPFSSTSSVTFVHTPTIVALTSSQPAPTPNISAIVSSTPVNIYQAFNISMLIQLPATFNNYLQIDVIPTQSSSDGSPRIKVCSAVTNYNGENVPCGKCLNGGVLQPYAQNTSVTNIYDSFTYYINNVMNFNLRTVAEDPNVNNLTISIIGQVLDHSQNTYGSNISIPIGVTFGNQTIWIGEGYVIVGGAANFSNTQNSSLPSFAMSAADNLGYTANIGQPRAFFLDIYTQPGSVYEPMNVEFVMPETVLGNNIPAATVCSVQMYYVGIYSVCAQSAYVNNYQISYLARMVQFKNDKAIVTLNSLCNSANPSQTMDPIDGLVRFLVYFSLNNDTTLPFSNYIGAAVDLDPNTVYVGQLLFTSGSVLPTSSMSPSKLYGYQNVATSNTTATGRSFSVINYVIKIPPSSLFAYNIQTSLTTSSLTAGDAAFCTVQISQTGKNVPCAISLNHNYVYSSTYMKISDYAFSTPICSINNLTSAVNQTSNWDEDSVNLMIITRPSSTAVGSYTVNLAIFDGYNNYSDFTTNPTFTVTASAFSGTLPTPQTGLMNSTIYSVDPANSSSLVYAYANYGYLYKGQTSIIRFNMTMLDNQYYDVGMNIVSSLAANSFQIVRFFVSNIGLNFPCASMKSTITFTNSTNYPYAASLSMGEVAYYPIAPLNLSSSTITFEAHVRIPWSSTLLTSTTATFTFTPTFNAVTASTLTKTTTSLQVASALTGFTSTIQTGLSIKSSVSTTTQLYIRQSYAASFTLTVPPFSNLRAILNVSCQDPVTGRIACMISSLAITSMGRNVDGLWAEYQYGFMAPYYFRNSSSDNYYNDTAVFDLGVLTNTAYGLKMGDYISSVDDVISFTCNVLVTDDQIANNSNTFPITAAANFNSGAQYVSAVQNFQIKRNGTEVPSLSLSAAFLNATNVAFGTNSYVLMQFNLSHMANSSAEAYNVSVVFYFPPYVTLNTIVYTNTTIVTGNADSAVLFNISRLHFTENVVCTFSVIIDANSLYATYVTAYGFQPPSMLSIPYNMFYYKYARYSPTVDTTLVFMNQMSTLQYTPQSVSFTSTVPMNPLISGGFGTLMNSQACRVTSSVKLAALSLSVTSSSITWTSNYRSIYWYSSTGTYVQISFGATTTVSTIQLSQLASGSYVPFTSFQVSFSDDGLAFAYLPVASPPSTTLGSAAFNYTIPNGYITCSYLRVHIIGVTTPASLNASATGLIISEIYGASSSYPACTTPATTTYKPQTYLYSPTLQKFFLCDENFNRTKSECFASSDAAATTWLVMPKVVSMVVFWVRDTNPVTNVVTDYLYGIASDLVNYVRSDDLGFSWIAVSQTEFTTMQSNVASGGRYSGVMASTYTPGSSTTTVSGSLWTLNTNGAYYNSIQTFDWFN